MIKKELIEIIFDTAALRRWNDQASPVHFYELDKQAHKAFIIYLLGKLEEKDRDLTLDWQLIIEIFMAQFLQRAILTDIKPPIFYELVKHKKKELNDFVVAKLEPIVPAHLLDTVKQHINVDIQQEEKLEYKLIKAAHFIASSWEFDIIYHFNDTLYQVKEIKQVIDNSIEDFFDLSSIRRLMLKRKSAHFIDMIGQLRFQKRWARTHRIPETSVLGHTLTVALFSYLFAKELDFSPHRMYSNFFNALFHDLPEVLTRDIITPVKHQVEGLSEVLKECEEKLIHSKILPLLPDFLHSEITFFVHNEFANKAFSHSETKIFDDIKACEDTGMAHIVDGRLLKMCDHLSAFVEATLSIENGIAPKNLRDAKAHYEKLYRTQSYHANGKTIDIATIFAQFIE